MELLDLPPELFQDVTHHLIELAGVRTAWELRATWYDNRFVDKWTDRYLEARLQLPLDADKLLLDKIQKLIDWTVHELGINDHEECASVKSKICTAIKTHVHTYDFVQDIRRVQADDWCPWRDWARADLDSHDKALGALAVGSYELLPELFSTVELPLATPWFRFDPLDIALKDRDTALLDTIFKYLKSLPLDNPKATTDRRRCTEDSDEEFHFSISRAVIAAMGRGNGEGLQSLLDFCQEHLPRPDKPTFDEWFRVAGTTYYGVTPNNSTDYIQRLMDFAPGGKTMLARQHFNTICAVGNDDTIQAVLTHLGTGVDNGGVLTLPIFVAVRSERAVAVNAVLAAGADPNITAPSNMRSLNKDRLKPIDVAVHRHLIPIIDALVQSGNVALPHISEWPTHSRTYNHLRNIVMKKTGAKLPVLTSFKRWSDVQRKAYKY
ncbi:hypothetical protein FB567DRAFT_447331 [Paraphoma chrysanthemicola]|uniref:Ankyrin repeat protein n=1 Tax=Paraphoma chrysanthemicola TaxID=798071 RepID=A0A8K0VWB3_9PLEO|nr:hypothetical protein FB567DRAFT_447331 [Paraphoma chrysanthemicola]